MKSPLVRYGVDNSPSVARRPHVRSRLPPGWRRTERSARGAARGRPAIECGEHGERLDGSHPKKGPRRALGLAPQLLPVAQRAHGNAHEGSEGRLRKAQPIADLRNVRRSRQFDYGRPELPLARSPGGEVVEALDDFLAKIPHGHLPNLLILSLITFRSAADTLPRSLFE